MTRHAKWLLLWAGCLSAGAALAHEGHGLPGNSHWHGSDTSWLLLVGVAGVLGWWLARRK